MARERQLQAERDHWRTLLEMTNAVVTQRDVAALRAAIVPNVRRIVLHDHTNLYLIDEQRRLGPFVIDPDALAWPDDLAAHIRPDTEPSHRGSLPSIAPWTWTSRTRTRRDGRRCTAHVVRSGVKRICNAPLATPHRVLGILSLGRFDTDAFHSEELDRVEQVAKRIGLALENALAFSEICLAEDRLASENVYLEEEIRDAQHFGESSAKAGR